MRGFIQLGHFRPDEQIRFQIERSPSLLLCEFLQFGLPRLISRRAEIDHGQWKSGDTRDLLPRLAVAHHKMRAQRFVASEDCQKGRLESRNVEPSFDPNELGNIVNGAVWLKLIQEPKPLLCER